VNVDSEALSRALWNLIENAAKYSDAGAPIDVFARAVPAGVDIGVRDRGPGIAPEERHRIFQKFVRGERAKASGARGVGIGLALVKTVVTAHGGSIAVESEPGAGCTFTVTLPAIAAPDAAGVGWTAAEVNGRMASEPRERSRDSGAPGRSV
jgi:signal transduction histidine kinase